MLFVHYRNDLPYKKHRELVNTIFDGRRKFFPFCVRLARRTQKARHFLVTASFDRDKLETRRFTQ